MVTRTLPAARIARATSVGNTAVQLTTVMQQRFYGYLAGNGGASTQYLKFYDKETAPTAADAPFLVVSVQNGASSVPLTSKDPLYYSSTLLWCRATTGSADSDTTSTGSTFVGALVG